LLKPSLTSAVRASQSRSRPRFSLSRRRDSLSFGHHAEVVALPKASRVR
jgi:hypothetical protein